MSNLSTLPKTNIFHENRPRPKRKRESLPTTIFQVLLPLALGGVTGGLSPRHESVKSYLNREVVIGGDCNCHDMRAELYITL